MFVQDLTKYYGDNLIFESVNVTIGKQDRIGLVGANGVGKTTLLKILASAELQDRGLINKSNNYRIGYLQQILTTEEILLEDFLTESFSDLLEIKNQMERLELDLADESIYSNEKLLEQKMNQYASVQQQWEEQGGYHYQVEIKNVVFGLGLTKDDLKKPLQALSGGQQMRAQLGRLLLEKPDLLLLDEPSNHLDIIALEWLEEFLASYPRAVVVVSHDRYFLNRVANKIWEIIDHNVDQYNGNYSFYQSERILRRNQVREEAVKQQAEIEKMEAFIRKFGAGTRARQAKSLEKRLQKLEPIKMTAQEGTMKFSFAPKRQSGVKVVNFSRISKQYDQPVLQELNGEIRRGERIALIGPNGSGKSTFLKILADKISYQGEINWGTNVDIGYFDQNLKLEHNGTVLDELYESYRLDLGQLRDVLARFLFKGDQVFQEVNVLSGGERNRLLLAKLFLQAPNLMLLDEPTNHLDLHARDALEAALLGFSGTILFITHDRYLVDLLATKIWVLHDGTKLEQFEGNYSQYRDYLKEQANQVKKLEHNPIEDLKKTRSKLVERAQVEKRQLELEDDIFRLEQEKSDLEQLLGEAQLYNDPIESKEVAKKYHQVQVQLNDYYHEWESVVESLGTEDDK